MSLEGNKSLVRDFLASIDRGPYEYLADDAIFRIAGKSDLSGDKTKRDMIELHANLSFVADGPFTITPTMMVAEGDHVAVEAKGHLKLKDGRVYENRYFIIFQIQHDKFIEIREYNDTLYLQEMFPPAR